MDTKQKTSFAMTDTALNILDQLADRYGISRSAMLEVIIREKAESERIIWRDKQPEK